MLSQWPPDIMAIEPGDLPAPAPHEQQRAAALAAQLQEAAAGGTLDFARFMELALYTPGLGYYSAGAGEPGAGGDFTTAPETSPLFGRCLASWLAPVLETLGEADVLELGPGSGALAASVLRALAELDRVPRRYRLLEVSGALRARQEALLAGLDPALSGRVEWLERLPAAVTGCVVANEVADAIPCQRVRITSGEVHEWRVAWTDDGPRWTLGGPPEPAVAAAAARITATPGLVLPEPYDTEVAPARRAWLASLAGILERGALLIVDYGFERRELYAPSRNGGTLACHYRHRVHHDPLVRVGLQDITSHVDFTDLAEAALEAGLDVAGYTTQGQFLLAQGLLAQAGLEGGVLSAAEAATSSAIKRLVLPGEMGEVFKVLALGRGLPRERLALPGRDLRARL